MRPLCFTLPPAGSHLDPQMQFVGGDGRVAAFGGRTVTTGWKAIGLCARPLRLADAAHSRTGLSIRNPNFLARDILKSGSVSVTLINNNGVTMAPNSRPVIDTIKAITATGSHLRKSPVQSATDIKNHRKLTI